MTAMSKGEDTRSQILDQALSMATKVGLEGLSIGTLAKEVEMSKSGLYAHFDSKEALQLQVMENAAERFVAYVVRPALSEPRGLPRIRALFEGWMRWSTAPFLPGGCLFIAIAQEFDDRPGRLRDRLVEMQEDWIETMATAARIAIAEKHFRDEVDPEQFAHDLWSICLAYQYFNRLMRDSNAEQRARAAFESLIQRSLA